MWISVRANRCMASSAVESEPASQAKPMIAEMIRMLCAVVVIASGDTAVALDCAARLSYRPRPMARPPYALIALLMAAVYGAASGQTTLAPQSGVLVLRNGQVLEG